MAFSYLLAEKSSCSAELSMKKMFYNLGAISAGKQTRSKKSCLAFKKIAENLLCVSSPLKLKNQPLPFPSKLQTDDISTIFPRK